MEGDSARIWDSSEQIWQGDWGGIDRSLGSGRPGDGEDTVGRQVEMGNEVSDGERTMERWVGDDRASGRGEIWGRNQEGKVLGEESRRRGEAGIEPVNSCVDARGNAREWRGKGLEKREREGAGTGAGRIAGDGEGFRQGGGEAEQGSWRESSGWRWGWSVEGMMMEGWWRGGP